MGDFNLNLLRFQSCKCAQDFNFSLQSFDMTPSIDKPTREHNNSYSLIDNIFTNNLESILLSDNIISHLIDHFSQFCILDFSSKLFDAQRPKQLVRDLPNSFSVEPTFLSELSQIDLISAVGNKVDVSKSFTVFHNKINKLLKEHASLKPLSRRSLKRAKKILDNKKY